MWFVNSENNANFDLFFQTSNGGKIEGEWINVKSDLKDIYRYFHNKNLNEKIVYQVTGL